MSAGRRAFEAYSLAMGGQTYDGLAIPGWSDLGERARGAWEAAATAPAPLDYGGLDERFKKHAVGEDQAERMESVREAGRRMAVTVSQDTADGRERSLALTRIEEAVFWANAGIAREEER